MHFIYNLRFIQILCIFLCEVVFPPLLKQCICHLFDICLLTVFYEMCLLTPEQYFTKRDDSLNSSIQL
jgi:hypothetical protein